MKRWAAIDAENVHLATIRVYDEKDAASGKQLVRTLSYSIPADLKGKLDFVHPTTA